MLRLFSSCYPGLKKFLTKRKQLNQVLRSNENENPIGNEEEVKVDDGGGAEKTDIEISDMDKLSNEILAKILDYLDEQQLVKCRILSSQWNQVSCLLLQDKSNKNPHSKRMVKLRNSSCTTVSTKTVDEFIECFSPSTAKKVSSPRPWPFHFSRFQISGNISENLIQMKWFFSNFGDKMKSVSIPINSEDSEYFEEFLGAVLHFLPNIEHLSLTGDFNVSEITPINPITKFMADSDPSVNPEDTFLKNLKVLEIQSTSFGEFNGFVMDLLDNSPNVEQVLSSDVCQFLKIDKWQHIAVWQQLNKAHLLKKLEITSWACSYFSPSHLMKNLRLETLIGDCDLPFYSRDDEKSTNNYIYHALKSSQDTLSSLTLYNLTVENLHLCLNEIKSLPNVRQLKIQIKTSRENVNVLERLSQICPNVKVLNIGFIRGDFSQVTRILWTRFKGLKSLKLNLDMTKRENNFVVLDSTFSGYSQKSIQKIQTKLDRGISLEKARRGEQRNPSISNLKDLSRLELQFDMGRKSYAMEKMQNQIENSIFMKILPQHIRENPKSVVYSYLKSVYD